MRLRRTPERDLLLRLRAVGLAVAVPALMRLPLPRLARLLEPRRGPSRRGAPATLDHVVAEVDTALVQGRPLVREGCLTRGVTRFYFLRRAGAPVDLVFGMGRPVDGFEGHCWLDLEGEPFLEATDPRPVFAEVFRIAHRGAGRLAA